MRTTCLSACPALALLSQVDAQSEITTSAGRISRRQHDHGRYGDSSNQQRECAAQVATASARHMRLDRSTRRIGVPSG
jgi:hypothetical protein